MKKSKFSESQIVIILKEAEAGVSLEDLTRQHGFSKGSFYKWKAKYSGMIASIFRVNVWNMMLLVIRVIHADYNAIKHGYDRHCKSAYLK